MVRMPEPDCFLRYRISAGTWNFTSGKSHIYVLAAAATRGFTMVLFTEPVSRRNTFVGGTCAPPTALLVMKGINVVLILLLENVIVKSGSTCTMV